MSENYYDIYIKLLQRYGAQSWWPADTPFEMLIGSILVQNTSWRNVEKAMEQLKPFLSPEQIEKLTQEELARLIRPSGFFNVKAKRIKAFIAWFRLYDYEVENLKKRDREEIRNELLGINGIGRETADVMLLYAFDKPIFVVDAYARRIFYRLGNDMPVSYDGFRFILEKELPLNLLLMNEYHALLVEHAKVHCKSNPICNGCPLFDLCARRLE
ncbi:endonuclease III domain-containing protein [Virgibacillus halodenitrificans]|uniref:endonuclease III domain-containing protein n=1 Tax=Virgibacillus halodenitrificans TaxID=1482 RepID=UPI00045C4F15|nr:endonuclease III domain-containing protein [Virgibacillus halodenitrificans]CDQ31732.1 UV-endonuclease [Virgibacillus halodenitrificans]